MLVLWPIPDLWQEHNQYPGVMSIAALLRDRGHRTEIVPAVADQIEVRLANEKDVILAYSAPSALVGRHLELNQQIKRLRPDVLSVFGGAHPTYFPEMIEADGVDAVCIGEGEYPMLELVEARHAGEPVGSIDNLWVKKDGRVLRNPLRPLVADLDELPIPDHAVFHAAGIGSINQAVVMTGRGCPHGCTYCFNHAYRKLYEGKGRTIRRRSVEHVMRELREVKASGIRYIRFADDVFLLSGEWVHEFAQRYREEIGLPFTCLVRAELVTKEAVQDLALAGCHRIMMGVEAGNDRLRNEVLKRRMSRQTLTDAARIIRAAGITLVTANILAIPSGSLADDWETVDLNAEMRPSYASSSLMQTYVGTEIHSFADSLDLLEKEPSHGIVGGGLGNPAALQRTHGREARQVENLHKLFSLVVWFPWLRPVVRHLVNLPRNLVFDTVHIVCVNIGTQVVGYPPRVAARLVWKKIRSRLWPASSGRRMPARSS